MAFRQASVFGDDIQACAGAIIALQIKTGLPWWAACLLTIAHSVMLMPTYYWDAIKLKLLRGHPAHIIAGACLREYLTGPSQHPGCDVWLGGFASVFFVVALIGIKFYLLAEFLFDSATSVGDFPTSSRFHAEVGPVWLAYGYLLLQVARPGLGELLACFQDRFRYE